MSAFDWDTLLDFIIQDRSVVPVIGQELLGAAGVSFAAQLAGAIADEFGLPERFADLRGTLALALKHRISTEDLCRRLTAIHRELLPTAVIPEPLRALAAVTDFPLFLTTMPDALLTRALRESRDVEPVVRTATVESFDDLPGECTGGAPVVYHLFGRLRGLPDFAVTESDVLEFVHRLHDRELRPARLFKRLRESHLLFIGQTFPDWLARVFLRLLRDRPVSARGSVFNALAGEKIHAEQEPALVLFLRDFSPQTLLYTEGDAMHFATELHRRWQARQAPNVGAVPSSPPEEPDEMKPGSVFISYRSADRQAAEAVAEALTAVGLDVWFDRHQLQSGDPYAQKIRRHIRSCDLFVPLISQNTESAREGFFRLEWKWALDRAEGIHGRFICPLVVDEAARDPYSLAAVPDAFLALQIQHAPSGRLAGNLVEELRSAVRERRNERATAIV